jgi:hypothetical protein
MPSNWGICDPLSTIDNDNRIVGAGQVLVPPSSTSGSPASADMIIVQADVSWQNFLGESNVSRTSRNIIFIRILDIRAIFKNKLP